MPMTRGKLEGALDFFDKNLPELIGGGLSAVDAGQRIRQFLIEATKPEDHDYLNARFDALLAGIASGALPARPPPDPVVQE